MTKSRRLTRALRMTFLALTMAPTTGAFADCPAAFATVQTQYWNEFIDGFAPRILPEVSGDKLVGLRMFGLPFAATVLGVRNGDSLIAMDEHSALETDGSRVKVEAFLAERLADARRNCELSVTVTRKGVRRSFRAACEKGD